MGFDNESIINIQSLPGEYFCPVCRQLVYPNEALQTQCTHLYCKPCLTYVLSTTRACPYDGYLVTDTDSKALQEANPALAETIGRVSVHCLYHKSGCTWQGPLSESIGHGNGCPYGSSPVVCNRCGTQIVHRQVQEHAQNCPGTQGQVQQQENAHQAQGATAAVAPYDQNQVAQGGGQQYPAQTTMPVQQAAASQPTSYGTGQDQPQGMALPQSAAQASATDQWYQQYQQYYQQYPQYDQYQQYQQYDQYQQQVQAQLQAQAQPQAQVQPQAQSHPQPLAQPQPQPQPQPQVHGQPQPQPQHHHQAQPQAQPQAHPQLQSQPQAHPQPQAQAQQQVQPQPLVQATQPYQQVQAQTGPPTQQLQPQHQIMQPQSHQLMPHQAQQVPLQQHPMPVQSQQQPAQPTQQHLLPMHQQFPPSQQPHMHQQLPSSQQPTHMQQQPAMLSQQIPQQQPHLQHHLQPPPQQQMLQQPPPQQQLMLQQQSHTQLQQPTQGPAQHPQQFPSQHQQMSHPLQQQPQQQQPFHPQPMQGQQFMQTQIPTGSQQHPQLQPPFQQGLPPSQPFPQQYPQNTAQMNAPQQAGSRPPLAQNQAFPQQPFPQSQGRPHHHSPYGQPMRAPNKALQAAPNQGAGPNQSYMPRPGHRAHVPHQRPPIHQSPLPRPNSQPSLLAGSAAPQPMRTGAQTVAASGALKIAPALEKPQDSLPQDKITKTPPLQNDHAMQPTKAVPSNETTDVSGQKNVAEIVKPENIKSENKIDHVEQRQQPNEKVEPKGVPAREPSKSEVSDSSVQQISMKDLQVEKHEPDAQLPVSQKKALEDSSEKPAEVGIDKTSQEPTANMRDVSSEHSHQRQGGNLQQYPRQVQETNFHQNSTQQPQELRRGLDEKKQQSTRGSQDGLQWQDGNTSQQSLQGQDRSFQQHPRQGSVLQPSRQAPVQGQDKNLQQTSRQGQMQGQDRNFNPPSRQGPIHGHDRNLQETRQGLSQGQNRSLQHPLHHGSFPGQDRHSQMSLPGPMQGQDRSLQQPLQHDRDIQQISIQSQVPAHERFQQPPRQGQLQGQQLPYPGQQPQSHERNFQQLPYAGQAHNAPEQFPNASSKQGGMPPMSLVPQHQPGSSNMPSFARGHSQVQSQPKNFDLASPSHLHPQQMGPPRSSQGESMLGLPSNLPSSMPHHLSAFEGQRSFMDRGMQFGQTLQQSPLSKPMDHMDILGNKRSELFDTKQNELQQLTGSRFSMTQPSGFQPNIMKLNGGTGRGHMDGLQASAYPPNIGEEGGFKSMQQDFSRQVSDRKEFQDNSRKYKPGQFDMPLPTNPDEMLPPLRQQKGQPMHASKFDQMTSMSRPLETGPHGFLPDSSSKYPFTSAGSPGGAPSRLFPPYQSVGSFPSSSGGPSMFPSDVGDGPRLPGIHEDMIARRPESAGIRPDFMGPRSDIGLSRLDPLGPPRSPGKDYMGLPSGRPNMGPSGGFGPGVGGPSHLSRPLEEMNREPLGFDEQRNKSFGFNAFQPGQLPMGVGGRFPPFNSGPAPGAPAPLPNHMMMGDPGPGFGSNVPMQSFPGESGFFKKPGQMPNDIEPLDLGRKRKPGSTGWCRICQIDCYTVEGLEQHTQTREHQKRAMDMVLSIKQDNAKRQKHSMEDPTFPENGNKTKKAGFEGRGSRR